MSTEFAQHALRAALGWLVIVALTHCHAYDEALLETSVVRSGAEGVDSGGRSARDAAADAEMPAPPLPTTRCGDGLITGEEKCDLGIEAGLPGACPTECTPLAKCAPRALNGTACRAECVLLPAVCMSADGCCPGNCTAQNDNDCSASCGDGVVQTERGETCEPESSMPCKTSAAQCSDDNGCTTDALLGSARNCNATCTNTPLSESLEADSCCPSGANANVDADCQPTCGNGVREAGEDCDQTTGCDATCKLTLQPEQVSCLDQIAGDDACARCACTNCTATFVACNMGGDEAANAQCLGVLACTRENNCVGSACYCGDSTFCVVPNGPCEREIEQAAGTTDPATVGAARGDATNPLGRAAATDQCLVDQCRDVCRP